jgi:uncharacterized membrane protein YhaH (DUF805 family)
MARQVLIFLFGFRSGRVNRTGWWIMFCVVVPLLALASFIGESRMASTETEFFAGVVSWILSWIFWAVGAKRCHDRDKSGWIQLIIIFPIIGFFWYLYELGFVRGDPWPNRFGYPPGATPSSR